MSTLRRALHAFAITALTSTTLAQNFTVSAPGGLFPTSLSGTNGPYPWSGQANTPSLPPNLFTSTVVVPPNACKFTKVRFNSLLHTWSGDAHFVLLSPTGVRYNLMTPPAIFNPSGSNYGSNCDFNGTYEFVDPSAPTTQTWPADANACTSGLLAPGTYPQYFGSGPGSWPPLNGNTQSNLGVLNIALESIPPTAGTWTLECYDWYLVVDNGTFASWDLIGVLNCAPASYCTSGTTSSGCIATIAASAHPSVSSANACTITVSNAEGQKSGLLFYALAPLPQPWCSGGGGASFLCVKPPTQRSLPQGSGGSALACDGALVLDWNAFQSSTPGALGQPWAVGNKAYVQGWFRDPPACKTTNLSNAIELTYQP